MRGFCLRMILIAVVVCGCSPHSVQHVVQPGQTLYRISKTYQIPAERIAAFNDLKDPTKIHSGQIIRIPGVHSVRTVTVLPPTKKTVVHQPARPIKPVVTKPQALPTSRRVSSPPVSTQSAPNRPVGAHSKLRWPVSGKVVRTFNLTGQTPSKGIDIAISVGTPVISAAAGKVIYSGNGIPGYGYVVIIEHDHALFTVYGYNNKILVATGSYVSAGQQIAISGVPVGKQGGQLHFEVWKDKKAVNPRLFLP